MRTAEEILKEKTGHAHPIMFAMNIEAMKEYAREVIIEDRKNVAKHAKAIATYEKKETGHLVTATINKDSIINAPQIELK